MTRTRFGRRLAAPVLAMLGAGCQGTLRTHPASNEDLSKGYEGVLFYPTQMMETVTRTTTIKRGGAVVASETGEGAAHCEAVRTKSLAAGANFRQPMILDYRHGILEQYTLAVTLDKGMLVSVNQTSTPDRGETLSNLSTAAKNFAAVAGGGAPGRPGRGGLAKEAGTAPCTDDPVLDSYQPYRG